MSKPVSTPYKLRLLKILPYETLRAIAPATIDYPWTGSRLDLEYAVFRKWTPMVWEKIRAHLDKELGP